MSNFVHLHVHSHYSLLDGMSKIPDLIEKSSKLGMSALALTDHGNMFGIKEFLDEADKYNSGLKKSLKDLDEKIANAAPEELAKLQADRVKIAALKQVKPIVGIEAYCARRTLYDKDKDCKYIDPETGRERSVDSSGYHLILLAKNKQGYRNLCKLTSIAYIDGFYSRPRIDHNVLAKHSEGLICCSACLGGEIPQLIMQNDMEKAEQAVQWFKGVFGDDYYIELQRHQTFKPGGDQTTFQRQQQVNAVLIDLARRNGVKIIATNDVHFVEEEHGDSHDLLVCISTNKDFDDPSRMHYTKQEWLKSPQQMAEIFADLPEAIENTLEVAQKVETYSIDSAPLMPEYEIPQEFGSEEQYRQKFSEQDLFNEFTRNEKGEVVMTKEEGEAKIKRLGGYDKLYRIKLEADFLEKLAFDGAHKRYGDVLKPEQEERLRFELHTIKCMGFPGYFLIVQDYIRAAREELDVDVGPGRGSAAGSLVAYCLKITDIDPLEYNLLFERFLNPDRISMPDIDTDFSDVKKVLEWVTQKYGKGRVAHIITYTTMATKMVLADTARPLKVSLDDVARLKSYIPDEIQDKNGKKLKVNLHNCYSEVKEFRDIVQGSNPQDDTIRRMLVHAESLENTNRNLGVHACGIIIGSDDLINLVPLTVIKDPKGDEQLATQYEGKRVESVGLIKMDFLSLNTLLVVRETLRLLQARGIEIDLDKISFNDEKTWKLFCNGHTEGVFQFESAGMRKYLRELQPSSINDIVAMNALFRPGPLEYIPEFIARRHGRKPIVYDIPDMEVYLKETYGITVYQEQVMLLSRLLANFTRGESDTLRKAMGKKDLKTMSKLEDKFIAQGEQNGYDASVLKKIWADWTKFASYAFNKSHAVCYAWVAYRSAWLKANYPSEFMAALLNCSDKSEDIAKFVAECHNMGIQLLPPDINKSSEKFNVMENGSIRYGLLGIKGLGSQVVQNILANRRDKGEFKDLYDLVERLNLQTVNRKALEAMVCSGVFDTIKPVGSSRRALFDPLPHGTGSFLDELIKYGGKRQSERNNLVATLIDLDTPDLVKRPVPPAYDEWPDIEKLNYEKDHLGRYISSHPLDPFRFEMQYMCTDPLERLADLKALNGKTVRVAGLVVGIEERTSKNGRKFGKIVIEDETGKFDFMLFGRDYEQYGMFMKKDNMLFVEANIGPSTYKPTEVFFNIKRIKSLHDVRQDVGSFTIELPLNQIDDNFVVEFIDLVERVRCKDPQAKNPDEVRVTLRVDIRDVQNNMGISTFSRSNLIVLNDELLAFINRNELKIRVQPKRA